MQSQPERSRKIVIAGDSLLYRMNASKMSVHGMPSVKITKKVDSLVGSINRVKNCISRHSNNHIDLVLLAGTNDLASCNASPELLVKTLSDQITELKGFNNLGQIFLCKIPHRFDSHVVNSKVVRFKELLHERFSDTGEFLTVVDTIPLSSNSITKMACILVMSGYPNLVAYCGLVCIEFLLLLILLDVSALELVVDAGNIKMAPVH